MWSSTQDEPRHHHSGILLPAARCLHLAALAISLVAQADTFDDFFQALVWVESRGKTNAIGDNGRSFGPAQISRAYFQDAQAVEPDLKWDEVFTVEGSKRIFRAYMRRWKIPETDFERMARVHNGGPKGDQKDATLPYWRKVQDAYQVRTKRTLPSRAGA